MIHWFPGHMAKAFKEVEEKAPVADLFIVVLDARAPLSSYNEDFDKIAPHKPRLFVITKTDLADPVKLQPIMNKFNHNSDGAIAVNLKHKDAHKKVIKAAEKLLEPKRELERKRGFIKPRLRAIVIGVPNSGKSTLINTLAKESKAKVGNMPGVTRGQQWINAGDVQLLDTPGILWPKMEDELIGIKLAIIGSIKTSIIPAQELFFAGYQLLSKYYPQKLEAIGLEPATEEADMYNNLFKLCEDKKFLLKEGKLDQQKGMTWFSNYVRDLKGVTYD